MAIEETKLADLKQKHGNVWTLKRGEFDIAFRKPTQMEYREYSMAIATDRSNLFDASQRIAQSCIVYPDTKAAEALLNDYPGLVLDLGGVVSVIASLSAKGDAKKA